jgi:hypothetical protein
MPVNRGMAQVFFSGQITTYETFSITSVGRAREPYGSSVHIAELAG